MKVTPETREGRRLMCRSICIRVCRSLAFNGFPGDKRVKSLISIKRVIEVLIYIKDKRVKRDKRIKEFKYNKMFNS